jgi:hypothetical protein
MPSEQFDLADHESDGGKDDPERAARQIRPRPDTRELSLCKIECVLDRSEVGARLIDVARCERVFIWHAHAR